MIEGPLKYRQDRNDEISPHTFFLWKPQRKEESFEFFSCMSMYRVCGRNAKVKSLVDVASLVHRLVHFFDEKRKKIVNLKTCT